MARAAGVRRDIRKDEPYLCYADNWDGQGSKGVDFKDVWFAMSLTHAMGRRFVEGEMDLLTRPRLESLLKDCFHKSRCGPVIQHGRRLFGQQPEFNRHGMPLGCPNAQPICRDRKSFLVAGLDDVEQLCPAELRAGDMGLIDQLLDIGPTLGIQFKPDRIRFVTQDEAQELA